MSAQTSGPGSAPVDAVASGSEPTMLGPELMVNVPLLRKAVEWAEAEAAKPPELCEWVQARYISYTSVAEAIAGGVGAHVINVNFGKAAECGTCFCIAGKVAFDTVGNLQYAAADEIAQRALGLTSSQANSLFDACNTIEDVRHIAESLAGERL